MRCVETLVPLGARLGLDVVAEPRLTEGASLTGSLELLHDVPDGAVLCSHGDIVPELIDALVRRGTELLTRPDWRKAALWVLSTPDRRRPRRHGRRRTPADLTHRAVLAT